MTGKDSGLGTAWLYATAIFEGRVPHPDRVLPCISALNCTHFGKHGSAVKPLIPQMTNDEKYRQVPPRSLTPRRRVLLPGREG